MVCNPQLLISMKAGTRGQKARRTDCKPVGPTASLGVLNHGGKKVAPPQKKVPQGVRGERKKILPQKNGSQKERKKEKIIKPWKKRNRIQPKEGENT